MAYLPKYRVPAFNWETSSISGMDEQVAETSLAFYRPNLCDRFITGQFDIVFS